MPETAVTAADNPTPPHPFELVTLGVATPLRPGGRLALDRSKQLVY